MLSIFDKLYLNRFNEKERQKKVELWRVLVDDFFQQYISETDTVVDFGSGFCEFINAVCAQKKIAIDQLTIGQFAQQNVIVLDHSHEVETSSVDVIFMCNFLEHLLQIEDLLGVFEEAQRILKPSGKLIILGPNMRFAYKEYWNFIDHRLALSDLSLAETLKAFDFGIERQVSRFLPFSTKSRFPQTRWMVRLYLKMPWLWSLLGKQYFFVATRQG